MPLHLLGKKSWNVYNADNVARVQRDEAAAAAEEHAAEQRMQDADAARRLAILRGKTPPPLPEPEKPVDPSDKSHMRRGDASGRGLGGKKRKRAGEDDTEFEMRVAVERAEEGARVAGELAGADGPNKRQKQKEREEDVSIVDSRGHIDLVGPRPKDADRGGDGGRTSEREKVDKYMKQGLAAIAAQPRPWYEQPDARQTFIQKFLWPAMVTAATEAAAQDNEAEHCAEAPTKDVWGRDDPKRKGREAARLDANDPLASMRQGAGKVRAITEARRKEAEERFRELEQLRQEERRREKRRKREQARAEYDKAEGEKDGGPRAESHRSGRSERRHRDEDERRESRGAHAHREERRRRREDERARERDHDGHHGRERERSREKGRSSRSHRDKDLDERYEHRDKDQEGRHHRRDKDQEQRHQHRDKDRDERHHNRTKD